MHIFSLLTNADVFVRKKQKISLFVAHQQSGI